MVILRPIRQAGWRRASSADTSTFCATSAVFSVIEGVLLRPLPYREPERLVRIYETVLDRFFAA